MASRVRRILFDRGVAFLPEGGRVLLACRGEEGSPVDLTDDLAVLLEAGLLLLEETSGAASDSSVVPFATLDLPDRMRVYYDGRRLAQEEIGAAFEVVIRTALRAALAEAR